jgi:hypothetical protein
VALVRHHYGEVEYVATAEVLEYRQSQEMSEADTAFIERVYDAANGDWDGLVAAEDEEE